VNLIQKSKMALNQESGLLRSSYGQVSPPDKNASGNYFENLNAS